MLAGPWSPIAKDSVELTLLQLEANLRVSTMAITNEQITLVEDTWKLVAKDLQVERLCFNPLRSLACILFPALFWLQ